jgi:hypothetical protein
MQLNTMVKSVLGKSRNCEEETGKLIERTGLSYEKWA